jgi:hypothetical protein
VAEPFRASRPEGTLSTTSLTCNCDAANYRWILR